jgi:hypothetical protein
MKKLHSCARCGARDTSLICEHCAADQAREVTPESFEARVEFSCRNFNTGGRGAPVASIAARSTARAEAVGVDFVSAVQLAEVIGVSTYRLETQFRPAHWCAPRDVRYDGWKSWYNREVLPELATELEAAGFYDSGRALRNFIEKRPEVAPWYKGGQYE